MDFKGVLLGKKSETKISPQAPLDRDFDWAHAEVSVQYSRRSLKSWVLLSESIRDYINNGM